MEFGFYLIFLSSKTSECPNPINLCFHGQANCLEATEQLSFGRHFFIFIKIKEHKTPLVLGNLEQNAKIDLSC